MSGQIIGGHYRVIRFLSRGGFGETYIAEDQHMFNSRCLIKQLKPASDDPETLIVARRLFLSEAQKLQQLGQHEQIPQLIAYFEENQEFYLVQEFIRGHPISNELTPSNQLNQSQVVAFLENLLEPLSFVHQQNIVHRDIKPDNLIRRQSDLKIVLIDFGAVKEIGATQVVGQSTTQLTVGIGTPGYMPSEQSMGKPKLSSDVYAVGVMAIQALTGLLPAEMPRNQEEEILWRHLVEVDDNFAAVINRMVRYHFRQRYHSAIEALEAVRQLQDNNSPSLKLPETIISPSQSLTEKHELTLEWSEQGETRTTRILSEQPTKNSGTFRIGRDPARCDLILSDPKVSRLHAEIRFDSAQQQFYLRSLNYNNPPIVNGQTLPTGELPISQNSLIKLGDTVLTVKAITLQQYPEGYIPTPPPINPNPSPPITTQKPSSQPAEEPLYSPPPEVEGQFRRESPQPEVIKQTIPSPLPIFNQTEPENLAQSDSASADESLSASGRLPRLKWSFALVWTLHSLVGSVIGAVIIGFLSLIVLSSNSTLEISSLFFITIIGGGTSGILIGVIQRRILLQKVNLNKPNKNRFLSRWVLLNSFTYAIGISLSFYIINAYEIGSSLLIFIFMLILWELSGILQLKLLKKLILSTRKFWAGYLIYFIIFLVFGTPFGLVSFFSPLFILQGATIVWLSRKPQLAE